MNNDSLFITVRQKRLVRFLAVWAVLLVGASLIAGFFRFGLGHDTVFGLVPQFNLDEEANIPTYFASLLLLISAVLLGAITLRKFKVQDAFRRQWLGLAVIFLVLAFDESAGLHEMFKAHMRHTSALSGVFYHGWLPVGIALLIIFALFYFRFLFALPPRTRNRLCLAGAFFLGGAIGMEAVGGHYASIAGENNFTYYLLATLEESMEMAGSLLFIDAFGACLKAETSRIRLSLE